MKKYRFLQLNLAWIFIAMVTLGLSSQASELTAVAPSEVGMSAKKLEKVSETVNGLIEKKRLAGASVIIARKGQVCFFETYGKMDIERDKAMTKDAIFRIYSMSKAITTSAVMQLVEQGKISPDDPIGKFIPEMKEMTVFTKDGIKPAKNPITVAQLMTHTSGLVYRDKGEYGRILSDAKALDKKNTLKQMVEKMGSSPVKFEPGTDWEYGSSIDVLGRLVEVVAEQPFEDYMAEKIFKPLAMEDTAFYVPKDKVSRFAANYTSDKKGKLTLRDDPEKSPYLNKPNLPSGGGGLVGTISDYMRFLLALRNGGELNGKRFLKEETVKLMRENHVSKEVGWIKFGSQVRDGVGYGFGFSVCVEPSKFDSARKVGDYGWGGAASTHYWVSPKDDLVVVTMEQTMPYDFMLETALKPLISAAVEK
jgi:CubicO group peptidase (beta-lactamase class C family)